MWDEPNRLQGIIHYNTDLFDGATIERIFRHFQALLAAVVAEPDRRLAELPILTEEEIQLLLVDWNDTHADYPRKKCVHELFEERVKLNPDAIAVVFEDRRLTYRELDRQADRVAQHLRTLGAAAESFVAICMERSIEMLIGLLAVLKSGAAYVPLDPAHPKERLSFILDDCQASMLLTQEHLLKELFQDRRSKPVLSEVEGIEDRDSPAVILDLQLVCLDRHRDKMQEPSDGNFDSGVKPDNPAYVIYTSGSTGKPKGVIIEHRSLVNYLCWFNRGSVGNPALDMPAISHLSFDGSLKQLLAPLLRGDKVWLLAEATVSEPESLASALASRTEVSVNCVPSLWNAVLEAIDSSTISFQHDSVPSLMLGGETSSRQLLDRTFALFPGIEVWNLYGPTEATANATCGRIAAGGGCPIGRPVANAQVYVLDRYLNPLPVGVAGELYIGGDGLARGYLNHSDLTAEKFLPNPFSDAPGARLYRTGDLARYLADGNLEFLGRVDHQVKIRGLRIELGEIESVLGQHPAVREGVVLAREDVPGDRRLVAYVIPGHDSAASAHELRGFLKQKLPDYMVPSSFLFVDSLPRNANNKLDRSMLPAPGAVRPELEESFVAPRTAVEHRLSRIWAEVLKLEGVGIHDNFFDRGGHSLKAAQVMSRIRQAFQVEIPLRMLFEHPTIAGLAEQIDPRRIDDSEELAGLVAELELLSDDDSRRLLGREKT
jgi:amino acid adenylation domain-containing protein